MINLGDIVIMGMVLKVAMIKEPKKRLVTDFMVRLRFN